VTALRDMPADQQKESWNEQITTLRDSIRRAFPVVVYTGQVTHCDGAWLPQLTEENAIHDDDMFVYEGLHGREWTDVSVQLLRDEPDGFVLLTDKALVAYLAAWLMGSLDDINAKNEVREFVVYSFSHSAQNLRALNREQRAIVRALLAFFHEHEPDRYIRERCSEALSHIDKLERDIISLPWLDRSGDNH